MLSDLELATRLAVAALTGLAVGIERERSGRATGPAGRFAGVRTFLLYGIVGGIAGVLASSGFVAVSAVVLALAGALAVAAYIAATRNPLGPRTEHPRLDGTTEAAALAILAIAMLAGLGHMRIAASVAAVVVLALAEKTRIQSLIHRFGDVEFAAALQFAVLALVVLPLLPAGPVAELGGLRPRALWGIVLAISALNFAAYLSNRIIGASRGMLVTGALGGLLSSTLTTLTFARRSRDDAEQSDALAYGALAACSVMPLRVLVIAWLLRPPLALAFLPFALAATVTGIIFVGVGARRQKSPSKDPTGETHRSPLRLASALRLAALFQVGFWLGDFLRERISPDGILAMGAVLGLLEMDALTAAMARLAESLGSPSTAAQGMAAGVIADGLMKVGIALVAGAPRFRVRVTVGLTLMLAATATLLVLMRT